MRQLLGFSLLGLVACTPTSHRGGESSASPQAHVAPLAAAATPSAILYDPCPTTGPCLVMPLGDSLTTGTDGSSGYRGPLLDRLNATGPLVDFVGSQPALGAGSGQEGHPGAHIDLLVGYASVWLPRFNPNVILSLLGTNDIDLAYAAHAATYGQVLDMFTDLLPDALVVVGLIPTNQGDPDRVVAFNAAVAQLVKDRAAQGKHVIAADLHAVIRQRDLSGDGVHLTHGGYVRLADAWYAAVAPFIIHKS